MFLAKFGGLLSPMRNPGFGSTYDRKDEVCASVRTAGDVQPVYRGDQMEAIIPPLNECIHQESKWDIIRFWYEHEDRWDSSVVSISKVPLKAVVRDGHHQYLTFTRYLFIR